MRRLLLLLIVGCLLLGSAPAHARYGRTRVDTWARYRDRIEGHNGGDDPLAVRVPAGSWRRVVWSVENLGAALPKIHRVSFQGCDDAMGFRFKYVTPEGGDLTWAVTHDGYHAPAEPHERAWISLWIHAAARDRSVTCLLTGTGNGPTDTVQVSAHS